MRFQAALVALTTTFSIAPILVQGHGYLQSPRSRNFYAHDVISTDECPGTAGCPPREYCHHCLNTNTGVCGKSTTRDYETAVWRDQNGDPMPWRPQGPGGADASGGEYVEGGTMVVESYLDTHHNGHMEIRACVLDDGNPSKCTTPAEFEGNELHFVEDLVLEGNHPAMYPDPSYPERGMYAGGQGGATKSFSFLYRLPAGISGEKVLLNWKYITANSCSPPGYKDYFAAHPDLPDLYWTQGVSDCTPPYPNDGTRSTTFPEQFFNCAEVSILPDANPEPTISPKPTPSPTTASPTVSKAPTSAPIPGGPPACLPEWMDCTYDWFNCCEGYKCRQVDAAGYGRCLADTCNGSPATPSPTPKPTPYPTWPTGTPPSPTTPNPAPPTGNPPTPPTGSGEGCCTINLKTCHHDAGTFCDLSQENCEGPCGKLWLPNGPLDGCTALWEGPCSTDADCCQHGECREGQCESDDPWCKGGGCSGPPPTTPNPTLPPQPTTPQPTNPAAPTNKPTPSPTPKPTSAGTICCASRNTGYQECESNAWCNENESNCGNCGGVIMSVPLERTGCCTWGGDCSGWDPSENPGCQYLQSDCEGTCWGTWQPF